MHEIHKSAAKIIPMALGVFTQIMLFLRCIWGEAMETVRPSNCVKKRSYGFYKKNRLETLSSKEKGLKKN